MSLSVWARPKRKDIFWCCAFPVKFPVDVLSKVSYLFCKPVRSSGMKSEKANYSFMSVPLPMWFSCYKEVELFLGDLQLPCVFQTSSFVR
ncbi:hypothetical protein AVEN_223774-1 [Araneus ventricosus]|uniref:Uncharacterized protein n=1 Tax=Araneus ventricosus TaxID=182803 RepID=A0A4Y2DMZ4_ARAVE|nr:hypothetical protein AVEN_223774-1 [Araneus ventricosus]